MAYRSFQDILKLMRMLAIAAMAVLAGCASAPPPVEAPKPDLTAAEWYAPATAQLAAIDREAEALLRSGRFEQAAAAITKGQPLAARVLEAAHPTLAAMEAASDLDDLYGRMLLHNQQYGWARSTFQKNVMRWKHWKPETPETAQRLKTAADAVAECDRRLTQ
jgi:hypothetical protein